MKKKIALAVVISFLAITALFLGLKHRYKHVMPLTNRWEKAVPQQRTPEGLSSLSAADCGVCHVAHYNEWKHSTHALAWVDLQFQAELKKESSPYLCINCHIPLQNQQRFVVSGLIDGDIYQPVKKKNHLFDKKLQQEGITCASCHVRNNMIIGPTGNPNTPHKTIRDTLHLSEKLCLSCHNASAVLTPTLACTFETGDEWKAGPYFKKQNCISCHMDTTTREIVPGLGKKLTHFHHFAGSGIPKFDTVQTVGLQGLAFYPSTIKTAYRVNEDINYHLKIFNENAGHKVPTGDPERFFLISFILKNEQGRVLASKEERIGEKWEWYPEAKKISDNNLAPKDSITYSFAYTPASRQHLSLEVEVTKHRLNKASAKYNGLHDNYPLFISVFNDKYEFQVN